MNKYRPRHSLAVVGGLLLAVPWTLFLVDVPLMRVASVLAVLQVPAVVLLIIYGAQWAVTLALYVKQAGKE